MFFLMAYVPRFTTIACLADMIGMAFCKQHGGGGVKKLDTFLLYPFILSPIPTDA